MMQMCDSLTEVITLHRIFLIIFYSNFISFELYSQIFLSLLYLKRKTISLNGNFLLSLFQ